MPIEIDIIVLSYRSFENVKNCLDSVLRSSYKGIKIYLVDNNSGEAVVTKIKQNYSNQPRIIIIENKKNLGFAEGNNVALRQTKGKYIVILNNDTIVDPDWLQPMVDMMETDETIGACQPKILDMRDHSKFEYGGAAGGFIDTYGYPFLRGRIFDTIETDNGQYDDNAELDWCSGTAFMVRNSILREAGLFDPIFFMYAEENDLCWRIKKCGYKIVFVYNSVIYHTGMGSIKTKPLFKLHLNYRNCIILLLKNLTFPELIARLPVRILLDFINAIFFLVNRPSQLRFISILWAYFEIFLLIPEIAWSRNKTQSLYKLHKNVQVGYPRYDISVIYQYFVLKRRKFDQLISRG